MNKQGGGRQDGRPGGLLRLNKTRKMLKAKCIKHKDDREQKQDHIAALLPM